MSEEEQEIVNPLVFQCVNCKTIIGDSFSWLNADQELNAITLTSKSSIVTVEDTLTFSNEGIDKGSAFVTLKCSSCAKILGKSYKATPRKWDIIREMFTFDLDSIVTYQLGIDTPAVTKALDEMVSMPSAIELRSTIAKLQTALLHLNTKVELLMEKRESQKGSTKRMKSANANDENCVNN